ncbi:hypothetical protein [Pseudomonas sp.]|uniref:Uncharacterized protein n=1 Tax=Cereibacter sphaeroides TaxID=1063 RepID=A0A2W5RY81_CERSP|nr:hypothetical protein [Pseudomonas sp.]MDU4253103.1 hypothetical protein [Pseudomonas sp.]PZQ94289.1 MAG: hypothetical protein DI533_22545 [Cereibacter sphaeroides]
MDSLVRVKQFRLVISMPDLYQWADDDAEPVLLGEWREIIGLLRLNESRIAALYDLYFDQTPVGQGNVYVFLGNDQPESLLAFDLYREPTDQLDIVTVGVCVPADAVAQIKPLLRSAFDQASCQILYEEGNILQGVQQLIDPSGYPKSIGNGALHQQLLVNE